LAPTPKEPKKAGDESIFYIIIYIATGKLMHLIVIEFFWFFKRATINSKNFYFMQQQHALPL